jgi:uncharacterized Fe-S cluster-containing protein
MAMVLLGRLAGLAADVVLHLVPSESRACRQVLLPVARADLVACMVLQTPLLGVECAAAELKDAAAVGLWVMVSAWELAATAGCPALLCLKLC